MAAQKAFLKAVRKVFYLAVQWAALWDSQTVDYWDVIPAERTVVTMVNVWAEHLADC